jgi:hypothetical protein
MHGGKKMKPGFLILILTCFMVIGLSLPACASLATPTQVVPTQTPWVIVITATPVPTVPPTQTPYVIVVTATPLPVTSTPNLFVLPTQTPFVVTATPLAATVIPSSSPTTKPTGAPLYNAPVVFDPIDGAQLVTNSTQLQWRWDYSLGSDEVFSLTVAHEGGSIVQINTREKQSPLDFIVQIGNLSGKFTWWVQVQRTDSTVLSRPSSMFTFQRSPKENKIPAPPKPAYP